MNQELEVTSPTYTIVERYELPYRPKVCHMDFYRLDKNSNLDDIDLYDAFENYLCIIEWPDKLIHALPEKRIDFIFDFIDGNVDIRKIKKII